MEFYSSVRKVNYEFCREMVGSVKYNVMESKLRKKNLHILYHMQILACNIYVHTCVCVYVCV